MKSGCRWHSGVVSKPVVIQQAYRFALAPTAEQEAFLSSCAGASRFWFNQGLALVKSRLDERAAGQDVDVPWSYQGLCVAFRGKAVKDGLAPWRNEVVTGSYQAGLEALGSALQKFSAGRRTGKRVGLPRFRSKGRCHEAIVFQRPRLRDCRHVCLDRKRLGPLRTKEPMRKLARLLASDPNARVMRSTVQRVNGGWVISFTVQRSPKQRAARRPQAAVGVDVGLTRLATLSTGDIAANARPLQAALRTLRRLQRQLDRQRRANNPGNYYPDGRVRAGPKTWAKSQRMLGTEAGVARIHKRVADLRLAQAHQLTTTLVREFGVIGVETLAVKNMMKNRRLSRHIADVGWGTILAQLKYKSSWSDGSVFVAADRFYPSSKTCSACGVVKAKLRLADRVFTCDDGACGHEQDRDLNAAMNLVRMARQHAQAEGVKSYVARIGRFTPTARGGQVSLVEVDQHSPVKREDSPESSPVPPGTGEPSSSERREALAAA
jgi:putative transposase